ncbi:hypothetical protein BD410DRAFT_759558 [Rickenella mellea]|uniref:FAM192A/Fyv6 N-terminal domain-containing protein n=1 Tax=Rickenella mellea TaxID=50990 RepID=A0A4Y7QN93_9AGAM|nr:hypothetical protein BD410DRAFT_759558 [Rickenella mellea]
MDDSIPSISSATGTVGSRFVSQSDIESAKAKRDEQWKAAYARLGQEPPPQPVEDVFDGRSLAEKLAANKAAKQEEWEEKTKLANQFRALEEDEVMFLDSIMDEERRQELKRKQQDAEEVEGFKQAVAAKNNLPEKPPTPSSLTPPTASSSPLEKGKPSKASSVPKKGKNALKGVIVKKKTSLATKPAPVTNDVRGGDHTKSIIANGDARSPRDESDAPSKRRKVSTS